MPYFGSSSSGANTFAVISPGGLWAGVQAPAAIHYNGYTYFGFVNSGGDVCVAAAADGSSAGSAIVMHAALGGSFGNPDLHDNPALGVDATTHKLIVAYSAHNGSHPLVRISTNSLLTDPTMSGGFAAEQSIGSAGTYTYMSLVQNSSGWWYLFCRNKVGTQYGLYFLYSTDNGATWLTPGHPMIAQVTGVQIYWKIWGGGTSRIDVAITDTDRVTTASSLYHFYLGFTGTNLDGAYKSDGTLIGAYPGAFPFDPTTATLVKNTAAGAASPEDVIYTGGNPAILLQTFTGGDVTKYVARYSAGWTVNAVTTTGGYNNGNQFQLFACFRNGSIDAIYMPKLISGKFELTKQVTADSGATWTQTALTSGSASDNFDAQSVKDAAAGFYAIYALGTFTSNSSYSVVIRGTAA